MKRTLSTVLAAALCLSLLPVGVLAAEYEPALDGDVEYEIVVKIDEEHFPDPVFREYVETYQSSIHPDGHLDTEECGRVTKLGLKGKGIADLKGIEYFSGLTELTCDENQLTELDVSMFPELVRLSCRKNQLTSLNVSENAKLVDLWCDGNQLTSLDVSHNTALDWLDCRENQLAALDVSANPALRILWCANNQLSTLDVSRNTALKELVCYQNQLSNLDVSANPALNILNCYGNLLTTLDVSHNKELSSLECGQNQLTALDTSGNPALRTLNVASNSFASLDVSGNPALENLYCGFNQLKELDVSANPALTRLTCAKNQLTVLDVSRNSGLYELTYDRNQLTSLDLSGTPLLAELVNNTEPVRAGYWKSDTARLQCDKTVQVSTTGETGETPAPQSLAEAKVTLSAKSYAYNGKAKKPTPTVKLDGVTLKKGTDYTVTYKNNKKVGTATVTIQGKGDYTGTVKATFKINPKAPKLSSVKNTAAKKAAVKWKKVAGVTGYQIQYSTSKKFTTKTTKSVTVKGAAKVSKALTKLTKGKTYYVRVRTYQKVSGKTYYSAWSAVKAVKITK